MYNWMFFPKNEEADNSAADLAFVLDQVRLSPVSAREWADLVPESHERPQGRTLGFCCGSLPRVPGRIRSSLPDFPVVPFVSDFIIEPKCWLEQIRFTVSSAPDRTFRIVLQDRMRPVISVTSTIPDQPPPFRVCGSYCFFGPPYILASVPPLKI